MKVLLLDNYENLRQQSMQRFAEMLHARRAAAGHEVQLVCPPVWLGRLRRSETSSGKWTGYIDCFLLYPSLLRQQILWANVMHSLRPCRRRLYATAVQQAALGELCHDMLAIRTALSEIPESPVGWTDRH